MGTSKWSWLLNADRIIYKLAIVFIVILVGVQMLHISDKTRMYISRVDRLEGEQITLEGTYYAEAPLEIKENDAAAGYFKSLRESRVLNLRLIKPGSSLDVRAVVNGKVVDDFRKGSIRLVVYDGDYVEVDATALHEPVQVIVNVIGNKIIAPIDGLYLEGNGNVLPIGKVKFKN